MPVIKRTEPIMKQTSSLLKRGTSLFAIASLLSLGAFAQDAPKLSDPEIAHVAVTANQIDVDYAAIAKKNSTNKDILHFAEAMAKDHSGVIQQAAALAAKLGVTPKDNAMSKSLAADAAKTSKMLRSLKGAAFDKAYIDNEVAYHKAVIGAVKTVLIPQTQNAELKNLLVTVSPVLDAHLAHAEMVQKEFSGKK